MTDVIGHEESIHDGPLLDVQDLRVHFQLNSSLFSRQSATVVRAVDGVDLSVDKGKTLGLVGESGCGKTTTGRAILQLHEPTSGSVKLDGVELTTLSSNELRKTRRRMQMVFQDPYSSLDRRMTVGSIINEPMEIHGLGLLKDNVEKVQRLLEVVSLDPRSIDRYPHELSGGQRQRVAVARAVALEPDLIVADEPLSALDVSVQAQIVNLLEELQAEFQLTYVFIAHDLAVVRHISDRVGVMYLGRVVEIADCDELYDRPIHPYTRSLLSADPIPDPRVEAKRKRIILEGDVPDPADPPAGCRFHTRCPLAHKLGNPEACLSSEPQLTEFAAGHWAACHFPEENWESELSPDVSLLQPGGG